MCMYYANRAYVCSCSVHLIVWCVHCYAVRLIIAFVDVNKTYLILITLSNKSTKDGIMRMGKNLGLFGIRYNRIGIAHD